MNPRRYRDNPSRSKDLLRQAVTLMSRQKAAVSPVSYAVWYEHVAGRNRALSESIARLTAGTRVLDDALTNRLYVDHIAETDERTAFLVAEGFQAMVTEMLESARVAGAQTERFETSLRRWETCVHSGTPPDERALHEMLEQTRSMREVVAGLRSHLDASEQELNRLRGEVDRVRDEALLDDLTGLANRRGFEHQVADCMADAAAPSVMLLTDIDRFKAINDTYGHKFGDQVLRIVAQIIASSISGANQRAARIGGEEFVVLLRGCRERDGLALAEVIRRKIAASSIKRRDSGEPIGQVTVSFGVAERHADDTADSWFERADRALYASKEGGRNRITAAA